MFRIIIHNFNPIRGILGAGMSVSWVTVCDGDLKWARILICWRHRICPRIHHRCTFYSSHDVIVENLRQTSPQTPQMPNTRKQNVFNVKDTIRNAKSVPLIFSTTSTESVWHMGPLTMKRPQTSILCIIKKQFAHASVTIFFLSTRNKWNILRMFI